VKLPGFADASEGPFPLNENETKSPVLHVRKADESARPGKDVAADLPFSDETHFTVAGVTDTTSLGGHGSDPVRRNSDALSRDAAKLNDTSASGSEEARIRERLPTEDNADLRFQLAEREEKSGRSLEAVHDYERAAVMDPSESHLFAWGAELLLHRAFDPSVEVFTKGRRLYPQSVRMALGLGSAMYARGSSEEAKRILLEACDIAPAEATPYRFLGGVQVTESALPDGWTDRLKRFAGLYPDNAQAHYFYAVALMKAFPDRSAISQAESELKKAVELDPRLGDAYLELGILASQRGDLPAAISYLQQAVANTTLPDDAHYRLAEVYRRLGDGEKARQESKLYKEISEKKNQELERERHELQQFVYTLREQKPASPSAPAPQ
jgi:tetratricopeptide (TPR) repeat protein